MTSTTEFTGSSLLQDEKVVLKDYVASQRLGEGGYASVFLVKYVPSGECFAMKIIPNNYLMGSESLIIQEATVMQSLEHPHVVKLYKFLQSTSAFYLIMELAECGELFDLVIAEKYFREATARLYFQQLMSAIDYCHSNGVAHRDLKAENLLLGKDNRLLVCDFGFCSKYRTEGEDGDDGSPNETLQPIGTLHYTSPEMVTRTTGSLAVDVFQQDLWCAGIILFFMLTGRLPFSGRDDEETLHLIQMGSFSFTEEEEARLTPGARSLVRGMLALEPTERPSISQILESEWFVVDIKADLFPHRPELKRGAAFLDFSTQHRATEQEEAAIRKAFKKINIDGYGDITRDQLRDMLTTLHGKKVSAEGVSELVHLFTGKKDSMFVTFKQFHDAWVIRDLAHSSFKHSDDFQLPKIIDTEMDGVERKVVRQVRTAFDCVDELHTGVIDMNQLKRLFERCQTDVNDEEIRSLIRFFDEHEVGNRGEITFRMFLKGVVSRDMLVRHPMGRKLAAATNLAALYRYCELRESVRRGVFVSGVWDNIVKKLMKHADRLVLIRDVVNMSDVERVYSFCYVGKSAAQTTPLTMSATPPAIESEGCFLTPKDLSHNALLGNSFCTSSIPMLPHSTGHAGQYSNVNDAHHGNLASSYEESSRWAESLKAGSVSPPQRTIAYGSGPTPKNQVTGTCTIDVLLSSGAFEYTLVRFCRISGRTHDFHEAVAYVAKLLEPERLRAMEDTLPRGESVLI
ncbi:protein kinase, putative [Trypanosoma equiperdum]|uniref:Protein kinase, putative n=2 Tax=Trypanozoon TaxID=39700 RepID=D0A2A6_TRYB9|nr:protein kinase, putative [Trypanosoma brucei gambiense DAL972]CBH15400.1 protein kinase, putative [Trypanosoma brucei gambiense DAL972]SCU70991.1 protein kinase, putative [Trypanosoma equiperdum]|eukprot:XP_011777664.1 protein kinase, putative [Trypanosoma brucei gambiense DAL972]